MHRKDVNDRSPLRLLERSIHGGLGRGNLGVVVARHGVGKTAFLVGVALDDLMRGRNVLHVSLEHTVERVCEYYDEIFTELSHSQALEDVWSVRLDSERRRQIHTFTPQTFTVDKLRESLAFMRQHGEFVPSAIMIDGLDFERFPDTDVVHLREIADACDAEIWMSAVTYRDSERNDRGIPEPVAHLEQVFDVILRLGHDGSSVRVDLLKDHENPSVSDLAVALDPTTMLLVKE